jgi:hypothetical protein
MFRRVDPAARLLTHGGASARAAGRNMTDHDQPGTGHDGREPDGRPDVGNLMECFTF